MEASARDHAVSLLLPRRQRRETQQQRTTNHEPPASRLGRWLGRLFPRQRQFARLGLPDLGKAPANSFHAFQASFAFFVQLLPGFFRTQRRDLFVDTPLEFLAFGILLLGIE